MCLQAAVGVELQCKREYWSESNSGVPRATEIHKLTFDQRKYLPSNNLNCERYLARFGYLASQSAAHSNKLFKGKRIRDDLMLIEEDKSEVLTKSTNVVLKHLDEMEVSWSAKQKEIKKQRLMANLEKKVRSNDFVDQLLIKCKEHKGPVTSIVELKNLVAENSVDLKTFFRQEIEYQRVIQQRDSDVRKDLYKVNKLEVEEMIENLTILRSEEQVANDAIVFPCEDEILEMLTGHNRE